MFFLKWHKHHRLCPNFLLTSLSFWLVFWQGHDVTYLNWCSPFSSENSIYLYLVYLPFHAVYKLVYLFWSSYRVTVAWHYRFKHTYASSSLLLVSVVSSEGLPPCSCLVRQAGCSNQHPQRTINYISHVKVDSAQETIKNEEAMKSVYIFLRIFGLLKQVFKMFVKILQNVKIEAKIESSEDNLKESHFRQTDKVSYY